MDNGFVGLRTDGYDLLQGRCRLPAAMRRKGENGIKGLQSGGIWTQESLPHFQISVEHRPVRFRSMDFPQERKPRCEPVRPDDDSPIGW